MSTRRVLVCPLPLCAGTDAACIRLTRTLIVVAIRAARAGLFLGNKFLKVRVIARLLGRYTTGGIVDQHHLQQVEALVVKIVADGVRVVSLPLGKRRLEVGIRGDARPKVL